MLLAGTAFTNHSYFLFSPKETVLEPLKTQRRKIEREEVAQWDQRVRLSENSNSLATQERSPAQPQLLPPAPLSSFHPHLASQSKKPWYSNSPPTNWSSHCLNYRETCPGWCGSVNWVPACEPGGCWFGSQSGHMPGLWPGSPVGGVWEATTYWCFSPFFSLPPPLSENKEIKS